MLDWSALFTAYSGRDFLIVDNVELSAALGVISNALFAIGMKGTRLERLNSVLQKKKKRLTLFG